MLALNESVGVPYSPLDFIDASEAVTEEGEIAGLEGSGDVMREGRIDASKFCSSDGVCFLFASRLNLV
jgi:hypothetical protein